MNSRKIFKGLIKYRLGIFGFLLTCLVAFTAIFAPFLAPYDPYAQNITKRLMPPIWDEGGSIAHLLGTDQVGRDTLSRIVYGARISLMVGLFAVIIAASIGIVMGLLAGYFMGPIDAVISYLVDGMLSIPYVLLAMALVATFGASFKNVFIVLGVTSWPVYARLIRTEVLRIREMDYVTSAKAIGMSHSKILCSEIFPNLFNSIIVVCTIQTATMIIAESFLSFLGLGVQPPIPSWGGMLADGRAHLLSLWWLATFPGIAIFASALGINLFGDGLRDILDPIKRTQA
jgi:peptide/nickel transport system permease protein